MFYVEKLNLKDVKLSDELKSGLFFRVVVRVDGAAGTRPVIGCTPSLPTQHARDWWMEAGWRPDGRLVDEWKAGWLDGCREATRGRPVSVVRTL